MILERSSNTIIAKVQFEFGVLNALFSYKESEKCDLTTAVVQELDANLFTFGETADVCIFLNTTADKYSVSKRSE